MPIKKIRNDDKIKFTPTEIIAWLGIFIGALSFGVIKLLKVPDNLVNYWISLPELICFVGLLFNIKWKYLNKSLNKRAIIFATILVALLLIPSLSDVLKGLLRGLDNGIKLGLG